MSKDQENIYTVFEVLFLGIDRESNEKVKLGPYIVETNLQMLAAVTAALENHKELLKIKLTSLRVKVRGF